MSLEKCHVSVDKSDIAINSKNEKKRNVPTPGIEPGPRR